MYLLPLPPAYRYDHAGAHICHYTQANNEQSVVTGEVTLDPYASYPLPFEKDKVPVSYFDDALFVIDEPSRTAEHAGGVELEFKESMKMRLEKGYILPGQADILWDYKKVLSNKLGHNLTCILTG